MKKTEQQNKEYEIGYVAWGNIRRFQYINHLSDEQIAEILGVSTRTLYAYDKEPNIALITGIIIYARAIVYGAMYLNKTPEYPEQHCVHSHERSGAKKLLSDRSKKTDTSLTRSICLLLV